MEMDPTALIRDKIKTAMDNEITMDCVRIDIKGRSRGDLLWRTLKNIRKSVDKVSEPLSKSKRRSLRRQLSFQVDDLERIILGVKPRQEDDSNVSEGSEDEEMRGEVEAVVKDAIDEATRKGKVLSVDYFENRMKKVERDCAELKRKLEEVSSHQASKRKKQRTASSPEPPRTSFFMVQKSPYKLSNGYGSDDHGYEGSLDLQLEQGRSGVEQPHSKAENRAKKETSACPVCGKFDVLQAWRCVSCRNFWNRLIRTHGKGKLLPLCSHSEPTPVCKGCRRRKYEALAAIHDPKRPLGIPQCPPPSSSLIEGLIKEESRELQIEYW